MLCWTAQLAVKPAEQWDKRLRQESRVNVHLTSSNEEDTHSTVWVILLRCGLLCCSHRASILGMLYGNRVSGLGTPRHAAGAMAQHLCYCKRKLMVTPVHNNIQTSY